MLISFDKSQELVPLLKSTRPSRKLGLCVWILGLLLIRPEVAFALFGLFEDTEQKPSQDRPAEVPPEYKGKHLPAGRRSDPKALEAGKAIYEGKANPNVNCAVCHGLEGTPTRMGKGAMDLTDPAVAKEPDDEWFWRISEGVPRSKMPSWKKYLTEDQRWQVIAYIRTFARAE